MQSHLGSGLHVAIIMDGNGRWAARRGLPRVAGHRAGIHAVRQIVEHAPALGINFLTLYAFSSDNWRRPLQEVQSIFWLMRAYLRLETERLQKRSVRLQVIGRRDRLPAVLIREIQKSERLTTGGSSLHLRVAVDYSSRDSISRAAVTAFSERQSYSTGLREKLSEALTSESGEVDLLIRTGGEKRLSDFLLWESAYAELFFTDRMWPDFDSSDLAAAVAEFRRRERRFGGLATSGQPTLEVSDGAQ
ncbi:MAG TPA: di-trans,poly-cis-decaprenylcistransferase [Terriglobales bacterium]|jgi:undecaprenyl diphosphate synthase